MVNGAQCTVVWYVDDLKISHESPDVVGEFIGLIWREFGSKMDLPVRRGKIHDYLGIQIDFIEDQKVKMTMYDYIDELIKETPAELMKGSSVTPTANHLFTVNPECVKLNDVDAAIYHHLTAKLLYLSKRTWPDLLLTVSFLTKQVLQPDIDDWKKLGPCMRYLSHTWHLPFVLAADDTGIIRWWVDALFAVHPNMRSHTGATMSLGTGCPYAISRMQKLNTRSSTESELVGVDNAMSLIVWTRNFLRGQGFRMSDNVIYQDNQSAMLLKNNAKMSSSKRTCHLDIRWWIRFRRKMFELNIAQLMKWLPTSLQNHCRGPNLKPSVTLSLVVVLVTRPLESRSVLRQNGVETPIVQTPVVASSVPESYQSNVLLRMIPADTLWIEVVRGWRRNSQK
jgi:hypothetical protein